LKKKHRIPLVIHSHNIEAERFRQMGRIWWSWYRHFEKWIHRKADLNFFITEEDRQYAINSFQLESKKTSVIPYGVPAIETIESAGKRLRTLLGIQNEYIFFFNGTLDYYPNQQALKMLVNEILPLLNQMNFAYRLVITGRNLPGSLAQLIAKNPVIIYKGFVEEINLYYQGADLFLNPVLNDAGIKTKLVEALGNGCTAISTSSGAAGINSDITGDKLVIVADSDWKGFADAIVANCGPQQTAVPSAFFDYYSWEKIAARAAKKLNEVIAKHE
jgi:polysaccharide biosynthesis protein PslH